MLAMVTGEGTSRPPPEDPAMRDGRVGEVG